jgi:hypothetical protein
MKPEDRDLALLWDMRRYGRQAHDIVRRIAFERLDGDPLRKLALDDTTRRVVPLLLAELDRMLGED